MIHFFKQVSSSSISNGSSNAEKLNKCSCLGWQRHIMRIFTSEASILFCTSFGAAYSCKEVAECCIKVFKKWGKILTS